MLLARPEILCEAPVNVAERVAATQAAEASLPDAVALFATAPLPDVGAEV